MTPSRTDRLGEKSEDGLPVTVCARRSNPLLGPAEAARDSEERGAIYAASATPVYTYDC